MGNTETMGQQQSRENNENSLRMIAQALNNLVEIETEKNAILVHMKKQQEEFFQESIKKK